LVDLVRERWRRFAEHLQPGRAPVLLAVLCVMGASLAAAIVLGGTARLVAGLVFLAAFIAGGLAAGWLLEPRERSYGVVYTGSYPPLPRRARAEVWVRPEGLAIALPGERRMEVIRHGLIASARVEPLADNRAVLHMAIDDRITRTRYPASLAFDSYDDAENLFYELARMRYVEADALWSVWRTVNLSIQVSDEDLRRGFRRTVPFTRQVACFRCAGIEGADRSCPTCRGTGFTTERDFVEVTAPPGTPPDRKFVFEGAGNEDPNGRRGPVVVRLQRLEPLELDPWPERDAEHKHV